MYNLKGEIKVIGEVNQVSDKFKKRDFVITDASGQYPQTIQLQAVQDRCELLDKFKVGDVVDVTFFLRGREWTDPKTNQVKVFNSLDAWKIESTLAAPVATATTAVTPVTDGDDDLPF